MQTLLQLPVFGEGQHCIAHFQKQVFERFFLCDQFHLPVDQHVPPANCFKVEYFSQSQICSFQHLTMPSYDTHQSVFRSYLVSSSAVFPHL